MANNVFNERPTMITNYFEESEYLNQHTQLHRAGLITIRDAQANSNMIRPRQVAIANKVGWRSSDYEVYSYGITQYTLSRNQQER
jgi:hypothetical protein